MIRHCSGCRHFKFEPAWAGTSDTPGEDANFWCREPNDTSVGFTKGLRWANHGPVSLAASGDISDLFVMLSSADECPKFEPAEYNK